MGRRENGTTRAEESKKKTWIDNSKERRGCEARRMAPRTRLAAGSGVLKLEMTGRFLVIFIPCDHSPVNYRQINQAALQIGFRPSTFEAGLQAAQAARCFGRR